MPRPIKDCRIHERSARSRLKPSRQPYWRAILQGFHLGYYKGPHKASWIARLRTLDPKPGYQTEALGEADDLVEADGKAVLSYAQALDKAIHWKELAEKGAAPALNAEITVREAVQDYIERRDARRAMQAGRTVRSDAHYKLTIHVLADKKLAGLTLARISEADLIAWQRRLQAQAPSSRQRVANELKAALNQAWLTHRRALPGDVPTTIRFGLQIQAGEVTIARARENQILADEQVRAIIAGARAIDADFGRLVALLAATGARFAQARRMCVGDVQASQCRLLVPQSFKGKRKQVEYIRVAVGADIIAALEPMLEGRRASAPLLERWRMRQATPTRWEPYERGPWKTPSEMTRLWNRVIEGAGLPRSTIPYALRHSSIVRGLRAGLPIRLVAALHDTSVAMIERHYSRWITEGLEELVARAVVPLMPATTAPPA